MTLRDIQTEALNLPIQQKWQLVQTLLNAIQQETETSVQNPPQIVEDNAFEHLDPWTRSLIGVIKDDGDVREQYINYLEEKYR
ncbi:hypothetical protein [Roseofilum casamattae]|uniref:DUF2281 domain-containing protein n=1 Tax=Roseofilum casamattae BLCC-M143 TaxID=3022442 RepID=A0ABT7BR01_9CYAN|nr:hypothetical protein [Roseofilum casamattae]MDJ1181615.1 hypothetical protein [Roseofilum casamattae BLCC-M143]